VEKMRTEREGEQKRKTRKTMKEEISRRKK
jgi:hypothetical protein